MESARSAGEKLKRDAENEIKRVTEELKASAGEKEKEAVETVISLLV